MSKNDLYGDFKKKLDRIQNHIAEEVAPDVNRLLKDSVRTALTDWYNDYDPKMYNRTYNFMKVLDSTRTSGKGNILTLSVDSGAMSNYLGRDGWSYDNTYSVPNEGKEEYNHQRLNASIAFDFMFMNGEHGHGDWMMHRSTPPYVYVDRNVMSGWHGRLNKLVNSKIDTILRK